MDCSCKPNTQTLISIFQQQKPTEHRPHAHQTKTERIRNHRWSHMYLAHNNVSYWENIILGLLLTPNDRSCPGYLTELTKSSLCRNWNIIRIWWMRKIAVALSNSKFLLTSETISFFTGIKFHCNRTNILAPSHSISHGNKENIAPTNKVVPEFNVFRGGDFH